jgi:hypothetical protein
MIRVQEAQDSGVQVKCFKPNLASIQTAIILSSLLRENRLFPEIKEFKPNQTGFLSASQDPCRILREEERANRRG